MRVLEGIRRYPGSAMAVAASLRSSQALLDIPESVMKLGLKSLKKQLAADDQPEVIIACDKLSFGSTVKIPGVRTAAIVSEENDEPQVEINVPCVTGVADLLRSVENESIVIVNADEGLIYLNPDVSSVIEYQSAADEARKDRLELDDVDASGEPADRALVKVVCVIESIEELKTAVSLGADAIVVSLDMFWDRECVRDRCDNIESFELLLAMSMGRPLMVLASEPCDQIVSLSKRFRRNDIEFAKPENHPYVAALDEISNLLNAGVKQITVKPEHLTEAKTKIRTLTEE